MTLLETFYDYCDANPHVYVLFKKFAEKAIASGRDRFAVGAIWERMRWELSFETVDQEDFKLNNNLRAYYARLFVYDFPQHKGFFQERTLRARGSAILEINPDLIKRPKK